MSGIVVFGGARAKPDSEVYKNMYDFISKIVKQYPDQAIITGGGPGVMEAANKAAMDNGVESIGFPITFANDEIMNKHMDCAVLCKTFRERKDFFFQDRDAFIHGPGGIGTADELFETLTLMKLEQIPQAPIICIGDPNHWDWLRQALLSMYKNGAIDKETLGMVKIVTWNWKGDLL